MAISKNMGSIYMHLDGDGESAEGLFILNSGGNFVYLNEKAVLFAGEKQGALAGKPLISIIPERERGKVYGKLVDLINGKSISLTIPRYEYGMRRIFELNVNPVIQNHKTVMFVGTIRDITYIKKMESERKKMMIREQNFRESVAHHFFNPLAIARGYLQLVVEKTSDGEERRKLESSIAAIGRVESVVKNVIRYGDVRE